MPFVTSHAAFILRRARKRIATTERWTQGTFGKYNFETGTRCECVNGALIEASKGLGGECAGVLARSGASLVLSLAALARGFETASRFNDAPTTTHADVLALLDEAIALAVSLAEEPS